MGSGREGAGGVKEGRKEGAGERERMGRLEEVVMYKYLDLD